MPTEDYSNTRRIARIRQIASLKGLNKVIRAIDSETQLVIKQGGILNVMKTPTGLRSNCGRCIKSGGEGHPIPTIYYDTNGMNLGNIVNCNSINCTDSKGNILTYVDIIPNSTITKVEYTIIYNGTGGNITVTLPYSFPINVWTLPNTGAIVVGNNAGDTIVFS
jgi:hypothetical protein